METIPLKWKVKNYPEVGAYYDRKCGTSCYSETEKIKMLPSHNMLRRSILEESKTIEACFMDGDFYVPEITIEQFRQLINTQNQTIMEKPVVKQISVTKTETVQIGKKKREITITVLIQDGKVRAGYSVRNPEDKKSNPELAKQISIGRALSDKTNLVDMIVGIGMDKKYILYAIAEQILRQIGSGTIQIKGIK